MSTFKILHSSLSRPASLPPPAKTPRSETAQRDGRGRLGLLYVSLGAEQQVLHAVTDRLRVLFFHPLCFNLGLVFPSSLRQIQCLRVYGWGIYGWGGRG